MRNLSSETLPRFRRNKTNEGDKTIQASSITLIRLILAHITNQARNFQWHVFVSTGKDSYSLKRVSRGKAHALPICNRLPLNYSRIHLIKMSLSYEEPDVLDTWYQEVGPDYDYYAYDEDDEEQRVEELMQVQSPSALRPVILHP